MNCTCSGNDHLEKMNSSGLLYYVFRYHITMVYYLAVAEQQETSMQ